MSNINSFFSNKNTIGNLTDSDLNKTSDYIEVVKTFSRITNNSVYVIDYEKKGFEYVSENPLFLNGHTPEEVIKMGYDFYFKYVPQKDLDLLLKINTIGFDFYETIPVKTRKNHSISYDFHLNTSNGKTILIHQKLTPIFLDGKGKIWKAICVVSLSSKQKSGNIIIHNSEFNESFQYDLNANCWITLEKISLSDREKDIVHYSLRGYSINEISEKLFISPDTIKFHRKKLFEKLEVNNISEAISVASSKRLI